MTKAYPTREMENRALEEYLTIGEVAERLKLSPKSVRNKMSRGDFMLGVHFFKPQRMSSRFKWSAIVAWLEEKQGNAPQAEDSIPMARGYQLGNWQTKKIDIAP